MENRDILFMKLKNNSKFLIRCLPVDIAPHVYLLPSSAVISSLKNEHLYKKRYYAYTIEYAITIEYVYTHIFMEKIYKCIK